MSAADAIDAKHAYDALAPVYDSYTSDYEHDHWLGEILYLAKRYGFRDGRVLDVACGTGESALPLAKRGYAVDACDISSGMLEHARVKLEPFEGRVFVADMRELPNIGPYALITCLDDAVDYLVDEQDLRSAMRGFASVLAPGGCVVFDVNTLRTYRTVFTADSVREHAENIFCLRGQTPPDAPPGSVFDMRIDVFSPASDGLWRRTVSHHRQRHQPRERLEPAIDDAGLRIVAAHGQRTGGRLSPQPDEHRDVKVLYVMRHAPAGGRP